MDITFIGSQPGDTNFLSGAFFNESGTLTSLVLVSESSTQFVTDNLATGMRTIVSGSGLDLFGGLGTINKVTVFRETTPPGSSNRSFDEIASVSDIAWTFLEFDSAIAAIANSLDYAPIAVLYNRSGPITVNASGASIDFNMTDFFNFNPPGENLSDFITQPMTVIGSPFSDDLVGGQGNDSISFGANDSVDEMAFTPGNDTVNFKDAAPESFYSLNYFRAPGIVVDIDSSAGRGTIRTDGSTDRLRNINEALSDETGTAGLFITGSTAADTYNIVLDGSDGFQWFGTRGNEGADAYNLTFNGDGLVRLDLRFAAGAIVADLEAGTIIDGDGFTDTISISGTGGTVELRGSDLADTMTGSAWDENFISEQGNDTVDGGAGWDVMRYDRPGADAVTVDLVAGTASGTWDGIAFTQTLSNIEEIRGSLEGDDNIAGSDLAEWFDGNGGDDSLDAAGGDDTLIGGEGHDDLSAGRGEDRVEGNAGDDRVITGRGKDFADGGTGRDTLEGEKGNDTLLGGNGDDSLSGGQNNDNLEGGKGNDTVLGDEGKDRIKGGSGNDDLKGGEGKDRLQGGDGKDAVIGNSGNDRLAGGAGKDTLSGGSGEDTLIGGASNDQLKGGSDADVFVFELGHGRDILRDLDLGEDMLEITAALAAGRDAQALEDLAQVVSNGVVLDFGDGDQILFTNLTDTQGLADVISIV